jgi:hypothetical protein
MAVISTSVQSERLNEQVEFDRNDLTARLADQTRARKRSSHQPALTFNRAACNSGSV